MLWKRGLIMCGAWILGATALSVIALTLKGEILEGELGTGAESRTKRGEQAEKEGEHGQVAHHAESQPCRLCGFLQSPTEKRACG